MSFILFAIIITITFFFVLSIERDIYSLKLMSKEIDEITNRINSVSVSKYKTWSVYKGNNYGIIVESKNITLFNNKHNLTKSLYFEINESGSDENLTTSCVNITNIYGKVVLKKCL